MTRCDWHTMHTSAAHALLWLRLSNLSHNLAIAGALTAAFNDGWNRRGRFAEIGVSLHSLSTRTTMLRVNVAIDDGKRAHAQFPVEDPPPQMPARIWLANFMANVNHAFAAALAERGAR